MSLVIFAGACQFAVIAVIAAGGDMATAVLAGVLVNLRFIPMSLSVAPSLPQVSLVRRCLLSLSLTDPGWALSARSGGRFDVPFLVGTSLPQYLLWQLGTVAGVLLASRVASPGDYGLDVLFPAFFLAILLGGELRSDPTRIAVAILGGLIALLLVPVAPAGVPLIAASIAAFIVLVKPRPKERTGDV
jgi:predicted branched-subunit amino acid permease